MQNMAFTDKSPVGLRVAYLRHQLLRTPTNMITPGGEQEVAVQSFFPIPCPRQSGMPDAAILLDGRIVIKGALQAAPIMRWRRQTPAAPATTADHAVAGGGGGEADSGKVRKDRCRS